jgi:sugar transferase (PEP-CTERM/EpsH1 system associated)
VRILFLASRMPYPPEGGDRFRVFHFLRTLAQSGHEVHLLTFDNRARVRDEIEPLTRLTARTEIVRLPAALSSLRAVRALAGTKPLQLAYYDSRRMAARAREAIDRVLPDVVYTHLFRMAPYALENMARHRARWILDLTDVISGGIVRSLPYRSGADLWIYAREGPRIERYERSIAPRFDECWVISGAEERLLQALAPTARVRVVPNGLPGEPTTASPGRDPARVLFLGFHEVFHNRDAVRFLVQEVFPRVRAQVPEAVLDIAGKGSEPLQRTFRAEGVRVLGHVADLGATLARATVFVAPHRFAAGVQNKVVLALACGTPVVVTPPVREGLEPVPEGVLLVGSTAEEIAARTVEIIRDPMLAARLGAAGRDWAVRRFSWEAALRAFQAVGPVEAAPRRPESLVAEAM